MSSKTEREALAWVPAHERVPQPGTECIVLLRYSLDRPSFVAIDTWDIQREDPTGMGGGTIETGEGWNENDENDVIAWIAVPPKPPAEWDQRLSDDDRAAHPAEPPHTVTGDGAGELPPLPEVWITNSFSTEQMLDYARAAIAQALKGRYADSAPNYQRMFESAVSALAAIDDVLGIGGDGCGSPAETLEAVRALGTARCNGACSRADPGAAALTEQPHGWLIEWCNCDGIVRCAFHSHNAIADYRPFDADATSTPLYRRAASQP